MKTSNKITALLVTLGALAFNAKAQTSFSSTTEANGIRYSVGVESGLATGAFHDNYKWNLGGSLQADIPVVSSLFITANAGYNNFFAKTGTDLQLIPVKGGLKYFPVSNVYIQGEAGASFVLNKTETNFDRTAAFTYAPQVGVLIPLSAKNYIDAGVRYERSTQFADGVDNSKVSFFGLRAAYAFGL